jgi:hypothetical protein
MQQEFNKRRGAYADAVAELNRLPTQEARALRWMQFIVANLDSFGDQEALVHLRSRSHACEREIDNLVDYWRKAETKAFKDSSASRISYAEATSNGKVIPPFDHSADIRRISRIELRDFWGGSDYQEFTIDATMLRTVEWCQIGGFDEWWERLAIEARDSVLRGGIEPVPASYWLFAMCRSNYARRLMGDTLERVLDVLELPSFVGPNQWIVWMPGRDASSRDIGAHLGTASFAVVASILLRPQRLNDEVIAAAVRDLMRNQHADGWWPTYSAWQRPSIETTAAAVHALVLLKPDGYERVVRRANQWLKSQEKDGHWSEDSHPDSIYLSVLVIDALALAANESELTFSPKGAFAKNPARESKTRRRFDVALSFPGERRRDVAKLANELAKNLGKARVFYDDYYKAELARPNLDLYLQSIYLEHSELVVVIVCGKYEEKEWCGVEWRAIREIIKKREGPRVMFLRADDDASPAGMFSLDGYVDMRGRTPQELASLIRERLARPEMC